MSEQTPNYKALIKAGRIAKEVSINDLLPFGHQDSRRNSNYAPTAIVYKDFVTQLVKDVHIAANTNLGLADTLAIDNTTGGTDISVTTGDSITNSLGGSLSLDYFGGSAAILTSNLGGGLTVREFGGEYISLSDSTTNHALTLVPGSGTSLASYGGTPLFLYGETIEMGTSTATIPTIKMVSSGTYSGTITHSALPTADRTWTLPDATGTIALLSDIAANNELSEILANGNTTGANDIVMTAGQKITSTSGGGVLMLDDGANYVNLGNSSGTYGDSGFYLEPDAAHMYSGGYSSLVSCKLRLGVHTVQMTAPATATIQTISGYTGEDGSSGVYGLSFAKTDSGTVASTSGGLSTFGAILIAKDSSIAMGAANTAVVSGDTIVATASNALYANELRLQKAANSFDGIFDVGTLTAARTYTFQDASGTVAFTSDVTDGMYDGSGTIPTTTVATITDTLNMNNGTAKVLWGASSLELSTDNGTLAEAWIDLGSTYNAFGFGGNSSLEARPDNATTIGASIIVATKLNTTNNAVRTGGVLNAALFLNAYGGTINSLVNNSVIIGGDGTHVATSTVDGSIHLQGLTTAYDDLTLGDAANIILDTTTGSKIGTATTQKIAFWNATPVVQPGHIADPSAMGALTGAGPAAAAALTQDTLTDNSGGTANTTIAAITNAANAGSADVGPTADAIADIAAQLAKIKTDVAAMKTAIDANNAAIDLNITDHGTAKTAIDANNTAINSILADLAEVGLQAAS